MSWSLPATPFTPFQLVRRAFAADVGSPLANVSLMGAACIAGVAGLFLGDSLLHLPSGFGALLGLMLGGIGVALLSIEAVNIVSEWYTGQSLDGPSEPVASPPDAEEECLPLSLRLWAFFQSPRPKLFSVLSRLACWTLRMPLLDSLWIDHLAHQIDMEQSYNGRTWMLGSYPPPARAAWRRLLTEIGRLSPDGKAATLQLTKDVLETLMKASYGATTSKSARLSFLLTRRCHRDMILSEPARLSRLMEMVHRYPELLPVIDAWLDAAILVPESSAVGFPLLSGRSLDMMLESGRAQSDLSQNRKQISKLIEAWRVRANQSSDTPGSAPTDFANQGPSDSSGSLPTPEGALGPTVPACQDILVQSEEDARSILGRGDQEDRTAGSVQDPILRWRARLSHMFRE